MATVSQERLGEIALLVLKKQKLENEGITLKPKGVKREIYNTAKKFGVSAQEVAQLFKLILDEAYEKTMAELNKIQDSDKVEGA